MSPARFSVTRPLSLFLDVLILGEAGCKTGTRSGVHSATFDEAIID